MRERPRGRRVSEGEAQREGFGWGRGPGGGVATLAGPEDDVRACVACVRSRFTPPTLVPMPIPCDDDDDDVAAALTAVGAARGSGPCFVIQ